MNHLAHLVKVHREYSELETLIRNTRAEIKSLDGISDLERLNVEGWKSTLRELRATNLEVMRQNLKPIAEITFKDPANQTLYIEECIKGFLVAYEAECVSLRFKITTTEQHIIEVDQKQHDLQELLKRCELRLQKMKKQLTEAVALAKQSQAALKEITDAQTTRLERYGVSTPDASRTEDGESSSPVSEASPA